MNTWSKMGNSYVLDSPCDQSEKLEAAIYKVAESPKFGLYLERTEDDDFKFPYKVYGVEDNFVDRVVKTYHSTNSNLGILLSGIKGTGKTVTAQMICNKLKLPVLIVGSPFPQLPSFVNDIHQDFILFFDEYEKTYSDYNHSILTVMDGVLNNSYRKLFMLTTNSMFINDNLIERPGRIRYIKKFEGLKLENIIEIVEDKLQHIELKIEVVDFISKLSIITIDNVKAIIDEVNIHHETPKIFADVFNVKQTVRKHNVYWIKDGKKIILYEKGQLNFKEFNATDNEDDSPVGDYFQVNGRVVGMISTVIDSSTITLTPYDGDEQIQNLLNAAAKIKGNKTKIDISKDIIVEIENLEERHKYFNNYVF